jgi:Spy/CpxP family protein refolding chaperone
MLKKTVSCFVLLLMLSPVFASLGHSSDELPPGRWWRIPYFYQQLNLTDSQKDELDGIFDRSRQKLVELKKSVEQQRSELMALMEQEHLNEGAVKAQMDKLEASRTVLAATRFSYSLEVRKLLGHGRYEELKVVYRKWQQSGPSKLEKQ